MINPTFEVQPSVGLLEPVRPPTPGPGISNVQVLQAQFLTEIDSGTSADSSSASSHKRKRNESSTSHVSKTRKALSCW